MIATTLYQIFHQVFLKRPVFIFYSRKEKERQTERERERNNTPTHRITESLFSSNRKFKPASFQNLQPPFYTYEQRLEQLENRLNGSEEGEEGADRSLARGRLKPRSKFWKRGWLRLHPTTGCQWCGIGSKGHATMRPRKAVSTRGGVSNQCPSWPRSRVPSSIMDEIETRGSAILDKSSNRSIQISWIAHPQKIRVKIEKWSWMEDSFFRGSKCCLKKNNWDYPFFSIRK